MPAATHTTTIAAPVDRVFAFVADGANATRWRPGVLDVQHVSGTGVGATYKQGVKGPGGRRVAADYVITAFEPNRRLAFKATAGPVRPVGEYTFEDLGGSTRLTMSLSAELSGLKALLMGGAVQRTMDAEVLTIEGIQGQLGA
jgi:uncharacterized protein YndB with AHSA1/START domain